MFDQPPRYRSYLLTIWEERSEDPNILPSWRFRLEDSHSGKRRGFSNLDALYAALKAEIEHPNRASKEENQ